jgi:hypothetical protein
MKFVRHVVIVLALLMLFGFLSAPTHAQDSYYVHYNVSSEGSYCSSTESWLAIEADMYLPDDVMVIVGKWWDGQFVWYGNYPGQPGYSSANGWFIEDVPASSSYPYTFTKYMIYYSPSNAMPVYDFWFTLTCDNGIATVSMEAP